MTPLTHRRVLVIALPIVAANVTVPLLGLVDTAVVGQLGEAAPIGAVGLGAVILSAFFWMFGFLRMGTTGLAAQAHGAGDVAETGAILKRGLLIAGAVGGLLIALQLPLIWGAFRLAPGSAEVEGLAAQYLQIRIWGAPATIGMYALTGWLIALERTRAVMVLQVITNGANIALDLWFVLGLGWGVPGVALATLIAEWSGLAFGLWLVRDGLQATGARIFDALKLRRMATVNGHIMVRSVLLQGCFTAFLFLSAGRGDLTIAANQILLQFLEVMAYLLDGFAFAAETLVGQAVGARNRARLADSVRLTSIWGLAGAGLMAALFALLGPAIIDLMTTAEDVRAEARHYLPWVVAAPLVGIAAWMFDGIFIGATLTREMVLTAAFSAATYTLCVWLTWPMGNHGLWLSLMLFNAARGLSQAVFYPRIARSLA
ncbi:MATE family efflux transporter [Pararhodobacter aggregans]|uniref:MATE family efflux transporter n=1 Tax=Pararhodobacter aggregans TaxID=404875 RepID=A0A2T7UJQ4_9RHOB|nr:MATE family efflux transporter [Pararhodobacter aggregans]PTW97545.1 MATE family multidrug resistance protein [Pararhodobacter aggregans]PVE44895.1 MATE family efflux transporter [Pararhodobacter aggregans]